jgi:hypothetical protein
MVKKMKRRAKNPQINSIRTLIHRDSATESIALHKLATYSEVPKAIENIGNQLGRLENVAPTLSSISGKMANIEILLKRIADSLGEKSDMEGNTTNRVRQK